MAKASKTAKKAAGKRTLIEPNGNKRFVRRDAKGQFKESDDVGRSLAKDVKQHSKKAVKPGRGIKAISQRKKLLKQVDPNGFLL